MTELPGFRTSSFVALLCSGLLCTVCLGSRSGDLEYWQIHSVSLDINKDLTFTAAQELRMGRHNGNPYLHNEDLGIVYKGLADWLDIGFNFRKEYEKDSKGKFRHENRPHLNLTVKGKMLGLDVSNRSRFEWRDRENKDDLWRYRNKSTIKFPLRLTRLNLRPYIAEEWLANLGDDNINENRLYSGFSFALAKNVKSSIYYMWRTKKISGGWRDTNIIGIDFKIPF
jgi:hypothetical protein